MLEIKDAVAVITGAGSGIGEAFAKYWVQRGGHVRDSEGYYRRVFPEKPDGPHPLCYYRDKDGHLHYDALPGNMKGPQERTGSPVRMPF